MRLVLLSFFLIVISGSSYAACDVAGATQLQSMLKELGSWKMVGKVVEFKWGMAIDQATPSERLKLLTSFADSDACIYGKARPIEFYRNGKLIGRASPDFGIKLVN